ncbi:MAG: hypothetical protein M0006_04185 [Magnetospirillum sp.]|nr:hypothetical protein [Magnetospirillum sp.]
MKRKILILALVLAGAAKAHADDAAMKPFILAWKDNADVAATAASVTDKLKGAGFEVVGSYSPYPGAMVVAATDDDMKNVAAKSQFGAYGAVERVAITRVGDETQVSYSNPRYYAAAYRMASDLGSDADKLKQALGGVAEFGPKDGLTADDLHSYRYMFGMEEFDDPITLAEYPDYQKAVAGVEKGLAAHTMGVSKVYRIDIPGKEETVFGVAIDNKGDNEQANDQYIMKEIDFKPLRSTAHLPYEMVVSGRKVYTLSARFRIAVDFPDLSMMGSNSFMNIMSSPDAIRTVLSHAAGGDWSVVKGN